MGSDNYTEDMGDILSAPRERRMALEILKAWDAGGLPKDFDDTGVRLAFNKNSGHVFLVNAEFQVCMVDGLVLESFYNSPREGREGFFHELKSEYEDMHREDQEWFRQIAERLGEELPELDD